LHLGWSEDSDVLGYNWVEGGSVLTDKDGYSLALLILQTPGHTLEELVIFGVRERLLFVGDSFYQHTPIVFPK
jgi:glyoxylase-like metal-dependent hydrolase (beta-lactamase superfamily II)